VLWWCVHRLACCGSEEHKQQAKQDARPQHFYREHTLSSFNPTNPPPTHMYDNRERHTWQEQAAVVAIAAARAIATPL